MWLSGNSDGLSNSMGRRSLIFTLIKAKLQRKTEIRFGPICYG